MAWRKNESVFPFTLPVKQNLGGLGTRGHEKSNTGLENLKGSSRVGSSARLGLTRLGLARLDSAFRLDLASLISVWLVSGRTPGLPRLGL